jgi:hypothetical protein
MSTKYKGIVVPLITPVDKQERIDEASLRKLVSFLIDGGVHGIFVNSTTGEGLLLREEEKKRILEIVIDQVPTFWWPIRRSIFRPMINPNCTTILPVWRRQRQSRSCCTTSPLPPKHSSS